MDTILAILGSSTITAIITTIINKRSLNIENNKNNDAVLMNRIKFLEERVERLEKLACFNKECDKRI